MIFGVRSLRFYCIAVGFDYWNTRTRVFDILVAAVVVVVVVAKVADDVDIAAAAVVVAVAKVVDDTVVVVVVVVVAVAVTVAVRYFATSCNSFRNNPFRNFFHCLLTNRKIH